MQNVLTVPGVGIGRPVVRVQYPAVAVRASEWAILTFLIYAAAMAMILPVAPNVRNLVVLLNLAVILVCALPIYFDTGQGTLALSIFRDWLPLGLTLLAYREMGWFALPHRDHALEAHWVTWDRLILRGGAKAAIEAFGPLLPSVLEIAYSLVYVLAPFSLAMLYLYGRRTQADRFLFIFAAGVLLCYAQFPFWPSEPPRVVFFGQDSPSMETIFRRFNLWMLGACGIHTSVFPSAHVGGAFSTVFGMWKLLPEHKWVRRFLLAMAVLIAVATVYGRYHYVTDVAGGLLVAVVAVALEGWLDTRRFVPAALVRARQARIPSFRSVAFPLGIILLFATAFTLQAGEAAIADSTPAARVAFARYTAGLEQAGPWNPETVEIDASLPKLHESGRLRAIRRLLPFGKPEYQVLEVAGDRTVKQQVIVRYLSGEEEAAAIPASSVAITPANYKFRYRGLVKTGEASAYVFLIVPRKKREGLIKGELWLDGETGAALRQSGYLVKNPSIFVKRINVTRETALRGGIAEMRVTHLSIDIRLVGRAELTIQERPLGAPERGAAFDDAPADSLPITAR